MEKINIRTWINSFVNGEYANNDRKTQCKAGWYDCQYNYGGYDWFCKDTSLRNKTYCMGSIIKQIKVGGKVDLDNWYIWFKRNYSSLAPFFDDVRFVNLKTGEVQFIIQLDCCWNWENYKYVVWGRRGKEEEFNENKPLFGTDSVKELVEWLNTPWKNEEVKMNRVDFCKYLWETKTPLTVDIFSKDEFEVPVGDFDKWLQYHDQITKKIEYLASEKGKEQRKKDYKVVDFETYRDIMENFPQNSDSFGHVSYVYDNFPNSVIVGMKLTQYSREGGYFHRIVDYMILKSYYDKWIEEREGE